MKRNTYIPPYTVSGKAMNLIAEIAAAVERYKIVMEGPDGVRLRKANHIRTIRGTTAIEGNTLTEEQITAIREASAKGDSGPFIDFMLDKILRTLKAKGEAYPAGSDQKSREKSREKGREKTREKNMRFLKDANLIRRVGPDKGGHWEVVL